MSAIAGLVRFDDRPIDPQTVRRLAEPIERRGLAVTSATRGIAALVFGRAPFVAADCQPRLDDDLAAVFDGRLDNRDELIEQLDRPAAEGDVPLVLAAYRAWGDSCAEHLLGEFAIAIVDLGRRRVLCVRDQLGVRNLYFRRGRGWFAFASAANVLATAIDPFPAINEGMIGEYLSSFVVNRNETVFDDVFRVPPACLIAADDRHQQLREYWSPSPPTLSYRRDDEYEAHARDVLTRAVAARLRGPSPVAIMLSGGLDSSSVTGIAVELVRQGRVSATAIETFSGSVPGPDDERPFFEAVSRQWGIAAHRIEERRPEPGQLKAEIAEDLEPQLFPHSPTIDAMRGAVRDRGIQCLLTGMGGDDWFGTSPAAYADLFRQWRWFTLARRIAMERHADHFAGWRAALQSMVWPLLPPDVRSGIRFVLQRGRAPAWIDDAFARRINLADRLAGFRAERRYSSHEQDDNWFQTMNGLHVHARETIARGGDRFGLTVSHPYFDRRVVEFALALPADQLARQGRAKDLLRRAMRAFIPDEVEARRASPSADQAFLHLLDVETGPRPFVGLQVELHRWIDGAVVRSMHRNLHARGARQAASFARILWGIQAVDHWMSARSVFK